MEYRFLLHVAGGEEIVGRRKRHRSCVPEVVYFFVLFGDTRLYTRA